MNKPLLKTVYKNRTNNSTYDSRWEKLPNNKSNKQDMSMQMGITGNSSLGITNSYNQ